MWQRLRGISPGLAGRHRGSLATDPFRDPTSGKHLAMYPKPDAYNSSHTMTYHDAGGSLDVAGTGWTGAATRAAGLPETP